VGHGLLDRQAADVETVNAASVGEILARAVVAGRSSFQPAFRLHWKQHFDAEEWLLIEWPNREPEPTNYSLSTVPADTCSPAD